MTARHPANLSESDIFLSPQPPLHSHTDVKVHADLQDIDETEASELEESVTHLFKGISGLLLALSLSFFLQAPIVSGGVLFALCFGWLGGAFFKPHQ